MPFPKLILAALLLLTINVAAGNVTLTCTVESSYTVDTTGSIRVSGLFQSIAPVFPGIRDYIIDPAYGNPIRVSGNFVYTYAYYPVQWDKSPMFNVTLEHYAPNLSWRIDRYRCVYNNSGKIEERYYDVVAQTPERRRTTVTFTVPDTFAGMVRSTSIPVSKPLGDSYCSAPPTVESWPNCPAFEAEPNKLVSVSYNEWRALLVSGRKPGETVKAYGVNATIPDPWEYGFESNVGTLSYIEIDGRRYGLNVSDVSVQSRVLLYMVGMPKQWGTVKVKDDRIKVPLYMVYAIISERHPTTFCKPPSCFVLAYRSGAALVARRSNIDLEKTTRLHVNLGFRREIHLPFGSVYLATVRVDWGPGGIFGDFVIVTAGTPFFRVINDPTYYEEIGKKGKINGPLRRFSINNWRAETTVAVAVDASAPSFEFDMYVWPLPTLGHKIYPPPSLPDQIIRLVETPFGANTLFASAWLTVSLKRNYPNISNGRYVDMLRFYYGYPTTYYWGTGDQYGMVSVRAERRYENTTADSAGSVKLYYVTGTAPTNVGVFNIPWSVPLSVNPPPNKPDPPPPPPSWLVWLVPTTACRSMFCTSLSPEVLGPLPPFPGDRVLPNMGYSIMLMYIGESSRRRVKVYVEDGYVISSGPPLNDTRVRNYKLVEIDKEWRPLEAVIVGPGWWVPYRQLGPCETMPVNVSSIYATPDRTGFFKIIVEVDGIRYNYTFYVTDDVGYYIKTRTPAPASITTTPFNITAYVTLRGVPYYHALYGYGEGGRLTPPACASMWYNNTFPASQLYVSGDFWGSFGLAHTPLKPVQIRYNYTKPRLELADPWRGLVRVRADGPVSGFAFYAKRGGTWVKIGETGGRCVLVNASRLFPWDPVLVLPLVGQELAARSGDAVTIWRPETTLLFKTWADVVGYPKGARSELKIVGAC
jgi:hypothetical protein